MHGIYNATHGVMQDIAEYFYNLKGYATLPTRLVHEECNDFFNSFPDHGNICFGVMSQGVVHLRNALLDYPDHLRKRIFVIAVCPGAYIDPLICGDVVHLRAQGHRDFIPRIDQKGARQANGTINTMKSHPNAPILDHAMMSETFQKKIYNHTHNFINSNGEHL